MRKEKLNRNAEVLCNNNRFENMDEAKKGNVQITTGLGCHEWNSQMALMKNRTLYVTGLYVNQRAIVYFNSLAPKKSTVIRVWACVGLFSFLSIFLIAIQNCAKIPEEFFFMFNFNLVCYLLSVFIISYECLCLRAVILEQTE